jgi:two-component system, response regulator PdtaR
VRRLRPLIREANVLIDVIGFEAELFYDLRVVIEMETRGGPESSAVRQVILIVEDEALVRLDAADVLRQGGYDVQEAANASDAMESLQSEIIFDLLFTDINLGKGINGIQLALAAIAKLPRLKVLVTTGGTLKDLLPEVLGKILTKPYSNRDLLARVKHALA